MIIRIKKIREIEKAETKKIRGEREVVRIRSGLY
jgi:hypothetical protein